MAKAAEAPAEAKAAEAPTEAKAAEAAAETKAAEINIMVMIRLISWLERGVERLERVCNKTNLRIK